MRAMWCESGRPMNCQVAPPSIDLKTPLPEYDDRALACSPVPTQTICEFDGATATAPTAATSIESVMLAHVMPLFTVFHSPPVRDAA